MNWVHNYKTLAWVFIVFALIGFADATFLTIEGIIGAPVPCSIITGCEEVLSSRYASIGGIPTASLGVVYYAAMFFLGLLSITRGEKKYLIWAAKLSVVGILASLVFISLQLFVIKAICLYCMVSAATSTALFALGILVLVQHKNEGGGNA